MTENRHTTAATELAAPGQAAGLAERVKALADKAYVRRNHKEELRPDYFAGRQDALDEAAAMIEAALLPPVASEPPPVPADADETEPTEAELRAVHERDRMYEESIEADREFSARLEEEIAERDNLSLAEFAETEQAARNAASWDGIPSRGNRGANTSAEGADEWDELFHRNQMEASQREIQGPDHYLNNPEDAPGDDGVGLVAALRELGSPFIGAEEAVNVAAVYEARLAAAEKRCAELERDGVPGRMHDIDKAFYKETVAQRDRAWRTIERLEAEQAAWQAERQELLARVLDLEEDEIKRSSITTYHRERADSAEKALADLRESIQRIHERASKFARPDLRGANPITSAAGIWTWLETECRALLATDLAADFGQPSPPTGASELARLVGLEGRVQGILDDMNGEGMETSATGDWLDGYRHGRKEAAELLTRALAGGGDDGEELAAGTYGRSRANSEGI